MLTLYPASARGCSVLPEIATDKHRLTESLLIAFCACFLIAQVLIRPAVGLSNNGDFAKMAGPLALGPEIGNWTSHVQYREFVYRYIRDDRYRYEADFSTSEFLSSEFLFVKLARGIQRVIRPGRQFDIRWLGAVHGVFFLLAVGLWIHALAPR